MSMNGKSTETFGRLDSWEEECRGVNLMYSQRQFAPDDGYRVLPIQERIFPSLTKCCKIILHHDSDSVLDYPIVPALPAPTLSTCNEILPSLAAISAEVPYRVPAHLDLNRIRNILSARRSASEDHL